MELRLFIPDTFPRFVSAIRYAISARKSPGKVYGIEDMRREHRRALSLQVENERLTRKLAAQRAQLIEVRRELTQYKRGTGSAREQSGFAKPSITGSTPAGASNAS